MEFLKMIWVFFKIGIVSFGGGWNIVGLIKTEVMANGWMTAEQFAELLTIVQVTPGPVALNTATLIGWNLFGLAGAVTATLSVVAAPIMMITGGLVVVKKLPIDRNRLKASIKIGSIALLFMTFYFLTLSADRIWQSAVIAAAAFGINTLTKINPLFIIIGAGLFNTIIGLIMRHIM